MPGVFGSREPFFPWDPSPETTPEAPLTPTDATRPDDPAENPGARSYEPRPVSKPVPGHRSPAPSEPGDIGSGWDEAAPPREELRTGDGEGTRGG